MNFYNFILLCCILYSSLSFSQFRKASRNAPAVLSFISINESGTYYLHYQEPGRSVLQARQLPYQSVDATSIFWAKEDGRKLLTLSLLTKDSQIQTPKLLYSFLTYIPGFNLRTTSLNESTVLRYKAQKWKPLTQNNFLVMAQNALYMLTQSAGSESRMVALHTSPTIQTKGIFGLELDSSNDYVVFSYAGITNQEKVFFSHHLPQKRTITINTVSLCRDSVTLINGKIIKLGANQIAYYCSALTSGKPGFVVMNAVRGSAISYESKLALDANSSIAIEESGHFVSLHFKSGQNSICTGNVKEPQNFRCVLNTNLSSGQIFTSDASGIYFIMNSSGVFLLDVTTMNIRKSPITLAFPLTGKILGPISL